MNLTTDQEAMLAGKKGWPLQIAMKMLAAVGRAQDAPELIPVTSAHLVIDGTALGKAGGDFLERLVVEGGRFVIPTSINAIAVDRTKPLKTAEEENQIRILEACEKMGALPSCSCNPFIQGIVPSFGEHVAWSESATAPYINSVLGARTNREGATAVASALTGLTPRYGMHLEENRRPNVLIRVETDLASVDQFSLLGALVGRLAAERIPTLEGLTRIPSIDDYVSFSAAYAIHSMSAIYHFSGITPEAKTLADAYSEPAPLPIIIDDDALDAERRKTANGKEGPVDVVSIGCPHASIEQLREAVEKIESSTNSPEIKVKFYIHTNRTTYDIAEAEGLISVLLDAGITVTADNCSVVSYDKLIKGVRLATNSTKMALFAKSVCNAEILFGSTQECIDAGLSGIWKG
ncbi:MAG: hypothetical protein CFH41_01161 [Alphaproteobacteria bacterium MarineAlpha11_Bin1]|nr:MAG: hypothetical protein CFH41_01161 [Alphaproteobacteria bacterium MarineAlpha11_Bin1]|tara:strand:- start:26048 stop:27265 length:1218 start_codon:yes stop_codon:yes gene_type:complete